MSTDSNSSNKMKRTRKTKKENQMVAEQQPEYTYKPIGKYKKLALGVGVAGVVGASTFFGTKSLLALAGVKALGTAGTIGLTALSAMFGIYEGRKVIRKIDGKTFYFRKSKYIVVTEDGEIIETCYKDIPSHLWKQLKDATSLDDKVVILNSELK